MRPLDEATPEEVEAMPVEDRLKRLEANDRTTIVERRRIIGLQRSQLRGVIALIALLIVVATLLGSGIDRNSHRAITAATKAAQAEMGLRAYEIASCKRGNERTVLENIASLDDYRFDVGTVSLLKLALALPQAPNPAISRAQQRHALDVTRRYLVTLQRAATHRTWQHLTADCAYTVDHPKSYRLTRQHRFANGLPPASALRIG